jgi:AcrR family transcriptional regulator
MIARRTPPTDATPSAAAVADDRAFAEHQMEAAITKALGAGFSAREVARRIGYSIGTIHNLFGTTDRLIVAINTRTFARRAADLRARLAAGGDGIAILVEAYFAFARANVHLWTAIYDHRLPAGMACPSRTRSSAAG